MNIKIINIITQYYTILQIISLYVTHHNIITQIINFVPFKMINNLLTNTFTSHDIHKISVLT